MIKYAESAESILARLKNGVTSVDTSEGSFVHDAQAPISVELANTKIKMDTILNRVFAKSALENGYTEELEKICANMGIERKSGLKANTYVTFTGVAGGKYPGGATVKALNGLSYTVINDAIIPVGKTTITVRIEAEDIGTKYNVASNSITQMPVKYTGITSVTNLEDVTNGIDEESNEELYNRYLIKVQTPATSGNKYHYTNWALEVDGVGSAKPYPLWNGPGTVKVVIANSNKRAANTELIQAVKDYIDPNDGDGSGVAPIGATLTVVSVTEKAINISANIQISSATTLNNVQNSFANALESYFKDTFNGTKVSIMKIGSLLFDIDGVLDVDYSSIKLNNTANSVNLGNDDIAVLGTITLGVI